MILRKGLAVFAFAIVLGAVFAPSLTSGKFVAGVFPDGDRSLNSSRHYVLDVLRENRTGLGALEELKLAEVIIMESVEHKLDPLFVLALIETESTFYNWSRSLRGAMGLMQIMPSTGEEIARQLRLEWKGEETLLDPYTNIKMGVHYFSKLKRRYKDVGLTLAAYNAGPGKVDAWMRDGIGPSAFYAERVLENYRRFLERAAYN
ncbi:MAG: lytic transglycosylase domain-containing protein [Thermodesulfobacteriota bacterium]|nr:MAG: lytic transglycosylase domain-containing protein [Thermodesulfobacteriota bacterium]